jgi:hypothetical protein
MYAQVARTLVTVFTERSLNLNDLIFHSAYKFHERLWLFRELFV